MLTLRRLHSKQCSGWPQTPLSIPILNLVNLTTSKDCFNVAYFDNGKVKFIRPDLWWLRKLKFYWLHSPPINDWCIYRYLDCKTFFFKWISVWKVYFGRPKCLPLHSSRPFFVEKFTLKVKIFMFYIWSIRPTLK